ncbi:FK506 suppressor Sfk1 [Pleurostoma richardsiae]|uniref:FK506 suppressor Sfk1 n=1 Tax=Pleurostoma richardsiae TaxID=41990 RepID=A0AA38RMP1_9PEZI|nr:FK506 suppressor Sfk1 [Pleurostoma richardsiae]
MFRLSYWVFPVISGLVWCGMLLGLLLHWVIDTNEKHYASMSHSQTIAYISDIGASELKPLFIAGCCVTTVFLDLSFASDRWLRHRGRLVPNTTIGEKVLSGLTIAFAIVGTAGLILLSIFDTLRHPTLHDIFLLVFLAGYVLSAIFICWEYGRLGIRYREHPVLRISFWIKLTFVVVEVLLAVAFVSCTWTDHYNAGAIFEWVIAFIFSLYVFSFYVDLYPAVYTRHGRKMRVTGGQYHHHHHHHFGRHRGAASSDDTDGYPEHGNAQERYAAREMEEATTGSGSERGLTGAGGGAAAAAASGGANAGRTWHF